MVKKCENLYIVFKNTGDYYPCWEIEDIFKSKRKANECLEGFRDNEGYLDLDEHKVEKRCVVGQMPHQNLYTKTIRDYHDVIVRLEELGFECKEDVPDSTMCLHSGRRIAFRINKEVTQMVKMEIDTKDTMVLKCACSEVDRAFEKGRGIGRKCKCWLTLQGTEKEKGRLETISHEPNFMFRMIDMQEE